MLQMLAEMVRAEELFGLVAFAEFMHMVQMFGSCVPSRRVGVLVATIAANVGTIARERAVESGLRSSQCGTRPRMMAEV